MPIKIVENKLQKYINLVVKSQGTVTSIVAMVHVKCSHSKDKNSAKWKYKALHIFLDRGSEGDLLFLKPNSRSIITTKERISPQIWRTSNGSFSTTEVGKLELTFPEFSTSKRFDFCPDIVKIPYGDIPPIYDVIIGVKSLSKIGAILNFANNTVTIDTVKLPMSPNDKLWILRL